jgi:N-acyl-D-aspartate/D-glutamate deacylase
MMETVEDIPKDAVLGGLPWDWEDYGGYLDPGPERLQPGLDGGGLVGHCAVRFYVMGEHAVDELDTEGEERQMADIVGKTIDNGAVGLSDSGLPAHLLGDGRSIPGMMSADTSGLLEIAKEVGSRRAHAERARLLGIRTLYEAPARHRNDGRRRPLQPRALVSPAVG